MIHHTSIYSGTEYMRYKLHMGYNLWDIYIWGYSLWNTSHMGIFFGWYFFYGYLINYGIYSLIIGSSGIYNKHQPTMIPAASWWQPMDGMDIFDIPLGIPLAPVPARPARPRPCHSWSSLDVTRPGPQSLRTQRSWLSLESLGSGRGQRRHRCFGIDPGFEGMCQYDQYDGWIWVNMG